MHNCDFYGKTLTQSSWMGFSLGKREVSAFEWGFPLGNVPATQRDEVSLWKLKFSPG